MKLINFLFIIIFIGLLSSCLDKDNLCLQEQGIEAIKSVLIDSVTEDSVFIARKYGINKYNRYRYPDSIRISDLLAKKYGFNEIETPLKKLLT